MSILGIPIGANTIIGNNQNNKGGDITFSPGKGLPPGQNGSVIWRAANGAELLRLNEYGISLFEKFVPLEKVLKLLDKLQERECSCSTQQILQGGCLCGGS